MRRLFVAFAPLLLLFTGCFTNTLPPETDGTKGRATLKIALDSWMNGGKMEDLKSGSPPITVYDPDWDAGNKLVKYDIDPTDGRAGVDLLLKVTLSVAKGDGPAKDKKVNFSVAIGSQTVVVRKE